LDRVLKGTILIKFERGPLSEIFLEKEESFKDLKVLKLMCFIVDCVAGRIAFNQW
jgi:hypothetical protein